MKELLVIEMPDAVRQTAVRLNRAGYDAVLVGGAVRDALLGTPSCDYDLVTELPPDDVRAILSGTEGVRAVYALGERFGTVGVALDDGTRLEVTRYRPDALTGASSAERLAIDAGQRDFTINAMGYDVATGQLLDPLDGRSDLDAQLLRAPGVPDDRLAEDPIRVLRAARFVAELGFEVEPGMALALHRHAPRLANVAVERIRDELTKLLVGQHAPRGLRVLHGSRALDVVLPEIAALDGVTQPTFHDLDVFAHTLMTVGLAPPTPVLRWAALLHDVGKGPTRTVEPDGRIRFFRHAQVGAAIAERICRRLCMSNADTGAIVHLVAEHMRLGDVNVDNPKSVDRAVRKLDLSVPGASPERIVVSAEDAVALTLADFGATAHRHDTPQVERALQTAVSESRRRGTIVSVRSPVSGRRLMHELHLTEGPAVGTAKSAIETAIAEGELSADDVEGALAVARQALENAGAPQPTAD